MSSYSAQHQWFDPDDPYKDDNPWTLLIIIVSSAIFFSIILYLL